MKSTKLLLLLLIASIGFTACGDDEDETIYGTWEYYDVANAWCFSNHVGLTLAIDREERFNAIDLPHTYSFKDDGTYQKHYGERLDDSGRFTFKNNTVTLISFDNENISSFKFNMSKGKAQKVVDKTTDYVELNEEGKYVIIEDKIREIMEKHPEETQTIVDSIISLIEVDQVWVAIDYNKK